MVIDGEPSGSGGGAVCSETLHFLLLDDNLLLLLFHFPAVLGGEVYITSTRAQNKLLFVAHSVNSCSVSGRRRVINWPPTRAAAPTAALDAESCAAFFIERCGMWRGVHIVRTENEIKNSSAQRIFVISRDGRTRWECGDEIQAVSFLTRIFFYWAVISAKKTRGQRNQDVFLFPRNSEGSETGKVSFWQDVFWPSVRFKLKGKKKKIKNDC